MFGRLGSVVFGKHAPILDDSQYQLLLVANVIAVSGTVLVSPILGSIAGEFQVGEAEIGLMISAFTAPSIPGIPIAGMLADRIGRKPILVGALVGFGLTGALMALAPTFEVLLGLRLAQGIAFSGVVPIVIVSIGDLYSGAANSAAQGIRFTTSGLGQSVFPVLAGILVAFGWQFPFLVFGVAVPVGVAMFVLLAEPRTDGDLDNPIARPVRDHDGSYVRNLFALSSKPEIGATLLGFVPGSFLFIGFVTYVSFVVERLLDGSPSDAGLLLAVLSLAYAATASQAGRVSGTTSEQYTVLVGANLSVAVGLVAIVSVSSLPIALLGTVVMGAGLGILFSLIRSVITNIPSEEFRGGLSSLGESLIRISATVAPVAIGLSIEYVGTVRSSTAAIRWIFVVAALLCGALGAGAMLVARYHHRQTESA